MVTEVKRTLFLLVLLISYPSMCDIGIWGLFPSYLNLIDDWKISTSFLEIDFPPIIRYHPIWWYFYLKKHLTKKKFFVRIIL